MQQYGKATLHFRFLTCAFWRHSNPDLVILLNSRNDLFSQTIGRVTFYRNNTAQSKTRLKGGLNKLSLPSTVIWIPSPKMARKPYQPSILDVCGEIMATALGKLGTSPSMVQPCAKRVFK